MPNLAKVVVQHFRGPVYGFWASFAPGVFLFFIPLTIMQLVT